MLNPKLVELQPDRSLLNSDFLGYKLSLTKITTITEQLKTPVDRKVPDSNQYSLLHSKLYSLHNHLVGENESVYFIDNELCIKRYTLDTQLNQFDTMDMWQAPLARERRSGDYNTSMKFASETIAVVADGMGFLYVLDRVCGSRVNDKWTMIFSGEVAGPDQNFVISDCVYKQLEKPQLHLLLTSIQQKGSSERFSTVLHWITLTKTDTWNQTALRELHVKGFVQYASLERTCEGVYVVSDSGCKFTLDSENEVVESKEIVREKKYTWTQSREDVTIKFPLPPGATRSFISVDSQISNVKVKYQEEILLEGLLYQRIEPEMTCYTFENNSLEVVLQKSEVGLMWPEIVEGDLFGEYVADPQLVREVAERLAPITNDSEVVPPSGTTFNSQQIEECDFESDKFTVFERLSRDSHEITHRINLGSHQVYFSVKLDKNVSPALGIRFDVDTCIWQPKIESNSFSMEHKGTLLAMGYIQASKQQMKFFTCTPDLSYSFICESSKHIFIYCQNKSIDSNELRNRITGQRVKTLAQQQVHNLPFSDEVLGIYASNSYLYVLGENFITALQL